MNTTSCVREREVSLSIAAERVTIVIRQIRSHRVIVKALFLVVITKKEKASQEVFLEVALDIIIQTIIVSLVQLDIFKLNQKSFWN